MRLVGVALLAACRTVVGPEVVPDEDPTAAWALVLADAVADDGAVALDRVDRDVLDAYVGWTSDGRLPRAKEQEAAFWLNARTARVMWLALQDGGVDARGKAFRFGLERLSIGEIDDERLRLATQDVRIHGALWRATGSGPPLRADLWVGRDLDADLDDQMRRWIDHPKRGVRIEGGVAVFDPTFADYRRDFDQWTAGDDLCTLAARYSDRRDALEALAAAGCPHRFAAPDLALDGAPR